MSWHYLPAPGEESSEACCQDGEPWRPSKSKSIHGRFYCNGKLTESYLDSLSGTTLPPSTESHGEEKSTLSPAAFPARIFPLPGRVPGSRENGLAYGQKWPESLAKYDQDSHSWKTAQCSLVGDLEPFSETWPRWGTMHDGASWELLTPELLTEEKEYGYWPTPTTRDRVSGVNIQGGQSLMDSVIGGTSTRQTYPTPKTNGFCSESGAAGMVNDLAKAGQIDEETRRSMRAGNGGQLNPDWVEWLMNWPVKWTSLEELNREHFEYWKKASAAQIFGSGKVREMWFDNDPAEAPQRPRHNEQQSREHPDTLLEVPRESTCNGAMERSQKNENMRPLREDVRVQESKGEVLQSELCKSLGLGAEEVVPRVSSGIRNRIDRLKAVGNGQVPAVAALAWEILTEGIT